MQQENGPLPGLIGSILVITALITLVVPGGWVLWVPVVLALAVVARIWNAVNH